jgi:alginate O-acetyltransferase complex protein AlgI
MLFNSYQFMFVFFPVALAVYFLIGRFSGRLALVAMLPASLAFYAWWDVRFLSLLISSFTLNYITSITIAKCVNTNRQRAAGWWLAAAIILNLAVLGVFKYAYFAVTNVNLVLGTDFVLGSIILPLGISFFTFE